MNEHSLAVRLTPRADLSNQRWMLCALNDEKTIGSNTASVDVACLCRVCSQSLVALSESVVESFDWLPVLLI